MSYTVSLRTCRRHKLLSTITASQPFYETALGMSSRRPYFLFGRVTDSPCLRYNSKVKCNNLRLEDQIAPASRRREDNHPGPSAYHDISTVTALICCRRVSVVTAPPRPPWFWCTVIVFSIAVFPSLVPFRQNRRRLTSLAGSPRLLLPLTDLRIDAADGSGRDAMRILVSQLLQ